MDTVGEVRQGEIVAFRVLMPDEDWLYLEGEVRHHVKGIGFGVQFLDLNDEQEAKVKELIRIAKESGPGAKLTADLVED
jgi:PilZ domain